jgi:hypothetical protein
VDQERLYSYFYSINNQWILHAFHGMMQFSLLGFCSVRVWHSLLAGRHIEKVKPRDHLLDWLVHNKMDENKLADDSRFS